MNNRNQAIAYYNRGCDLLKKDCDREALKEFEKAIECDPGYVSAFVNAGYCSRRLMRYDESAYYCIKAIELDNKNRLAHFNYGCTLGCMDRYQEALDELKIALDMAPDDEETLLQLARCYALLKKPRKGFNYAVKALRLHPSSREAYQVISLLAALTFWNTLIAVARCFRPF